MEGFVRNFVRASLVWLGVGISIGLLMALWPPAIAYRTAHMHANLLGFVSMMIFGVAYHVIPRFTGRPLHDRRLGAIHLVAANLGLALMVAGWIARAHLPWLAILPLRVGAVLSAGGAALFIFNIWRTLEPLPAANPAAAGGARLPIRP